MAFVAHGRFIVFDWAREMLDHGHDVYLFTNYPASAVESFGFPRDRLRSFLLHGLAARAAWVLRDRSSLLYPESLLHRGFGRWAAAQLASDNWDLVIAASGVAEESLCVLEGRSTIRVVARFSSHIRTQARLLREEEERTGARQDRPSEWMIRREEREYDLADRVVVISSFARDSFIAEGVDSRKVATFPIGTGLDHFRPTPEVIEARCRRIVQGDPIRVLYVGALSFRKGLWDLLAVAEELGGARFEFKLVGPRAAEASRLLTQAPRHVSISPKVPESELPEQYAWGDVFLFPTIEDGYAVVLAQAAAGALPIITTTNSAGRDLVHDDENGWVVPIRSASKFAERLRWCDSHRQELVTMIRAVYAHPQADRQPSLAASFDTLRAQYSSVGRPNRLSDA